MHKFLSLLLPAQPTPIYLFTRNVLVLGICLFFATKAMNSWIEYRLQLPPELLSFTAPESTGQEGSNPDFQEKTNVDIQAIVRGNIFGGSPVEPDKHSAQNSAIQLDKIPLAENLKEYRLLGTIITSDGNSWAIIENTKKNTQELKTVGDTIKDARITNIVRNNVIVNEGDQDAALSIDYKVRARLQGISSQKTQPAADSEKQQQTVTLDQENVQSALSNFHDILEQASIRPYLQDETSVGMQVRNIQQGSFFDSLHLQNGDILIRTQGSELRSPQGIFDLVQEIETTDNLQLRIRRNGQEMTMHYRLQ